MHLESASLRKLYILSKQTGLRRHLHIVRLAPGYVHLIHRVIACQNVLCSVSWQLRVMSSLDNSCISYNVEELFSECLDTSR